MKRIKKFLIPPKAVMTMDDKAVGIINWTDCMYQVSFRMIKPKKEKK